MMSASGSAKKSDNEKERRKTSVDDVGSTDESDREEGSAKEDYIGQGTSKENAKEPKKLGYPNPDELAAMTNKKGPLQNWKEVSKIMRGPMCWKCYLWATFFTCEKCNRSYHRECVFMVPGFPAPIFSASVEVAGMADWDTVNLVECSNCIVEANTKVAKMANVSGKHLNEGLHLIAAHYFADFNILEAYAKDFNPDDLSLLNIKDKASKGEFKTVEEFYASFKHIAYKIVTRYSKESEAYQVVTRLLTLVITELQTMMACLECYLKRYDSNGKLLNSAKYIPVNTELCQVPHPVIWTKEDTFPYWPAKLLSIGKEELIVQCFREKAIVRVFPYTEKTKGAYKKYSFKYPGKKAAHNNAWAGAIADCKKYLDNARIRFGEEGVVVPEESEPFDCTEKEALEAMFPLYEMDG